MILTVTITQSMFRQGKKLYLLARDMLREPWSKTGKDVFKILWDTQGLLLSAPQLSEAPSSFASGSMPSTSGSLTASAHRSFSSTRTSVTSEAISVNREAAESETSCSLCFHQFSSRDQNKYAVQFTLNDGSPSEHAYCRGCAISHLQSTIYTQFTDPKSGKQLRFRKGLKPEQGFVRNRTIENVAELLSLQISLTATEK